MECSICKKPTNKSCSRCKSKYYCSPSCQKKDYTNHVLDCPPRSVDILVTNVCQDLIPTNMAVLHEYGFNNCMNPKDKSMLLGLYQGLIKYVGCSASQIHSWWENGDLSRNIKKAFEDANFKSGYYYWFLKNEHLLHDLHKYEGEKSDKAMVNRIHAMVKPYLSEHDQTIPFESFRDSIPESKSKVFDLYIIILMGNIPGIEFPSWIDFGFCTCKFGNGHLGEEEEIRLSKLYRELIVQRGCKIDEFHDAYVSGSVVDLLKRKCDDCNWLSESGIEIFKYRQPIKSVYSLKQYALSESSDIQPPLPVKVDYGFINCRTKDEIKQLKHIYKKLIKTPQFDPRDLHKACVAGKIFNYVKSMLPNEALRSDLLRNHYPLKDLE